MSPIALAVFEASLKRCEARSARPCTICGWTACSIRCAPAIPSASRRRRPPGRKSWWSGSTTSARTTRGGTGGDAIVIEEEAW